VQLGSCTVWIHVKYPEVGGIGAEQVRANVRLLAEHALATDGLRAFECPKLTAAWHEAGHAVIDAHHGVVPTCVSIWPVQVPGFVEPHWEGRCESPLPPIGLSTDPQQDIAFARRILAGVISELTFVADHGLGSSIDETAIAQVVITIAAAKLGRVAKDLFHETIDEIKAQLQAHEKTVRAFADELMDKHRLGASQLKALLRPVRERR
jgi:hypothetical protein